MRFSSQFVSRAGAAALILVLGSASLVQGQRGRALGPVDGAGLPPTDTTRVAIGTQAPDFTLETLEGRVTLSEFRDKQNVILVFYRGHW